MSAGGWSLMLTVLAWSSPNCHLAPFLHSLCPPQFPPPSSHSPTLSHPFPSPAICCSVLLYSSKFEGMNLYHCNAVRMASSLFAYSLWVVMQSGYLDCSVWRCDGPASQTNSTLRWIWFHFYSKQLKVQGPGTLDRSIGSYFLTKHLTHHPCHTAPIVAMMFGVIVSLFCLLCFTK